MDSFNKDVVTPGATTTNARHPFSSRVYEWSQSAIGAVYNINQAGTVGYINSLTDADLYYVPRSVGAPGTVAGNNDRWVYIVTNASIGSAVAGLFGANVSFDLEIAQGYGPCGASVGWSLDFIISSLSRR
jgi:hypothetical protein